MATLEDVARLAGTLPDVVEGERRGTRTWSVGGRVFAWERPFSKADLRRFGGEPVPEGPIAAFRVADLEAKEVALAAGQRGVFTIEHFRGYAAILVQLSIVEEDVLRDALTDAWLSKAPPALVTRYLDS